MFKQEPCILTSKRFPTISWKLLQDLLKNSQDFVFRLPDTKSKCEINRGSKLYLKTLHLSQQHANEVGSQVTFVQNLRLSDDAASSEKLHNHVNHACAENNSHTPSHSANHLDKNVRKVKPGKTDKGM